MAFETTGCALPMTAPHENTVIRYYGIGMTRQLEARYKLHRKRRDKYITRSYQTKIQPKRMKPKRSLCPGAVSFLLLSSSIIGFCDGISVLGRTVQKPRLGFHTPTLLKPYYPSTSRTLLFPKKKGRNDYHSWHLRMSNEQADDADHPKGKGDKSFGAGSNRDNKNRNTNRNSYGRNSRKKRSNQKRTQPKINSSTRVKKESLSKTSSTKESEEIIHRITQLEALVATQTVELRKLKLENQKLTEATEIFAQVVDLMRQAGISVETEQTEAEDSPSLSINKSADSNDSKEQIKQFQYFDDEIFGTAPSSITDAADSAGGSILAALLGGKQRMLVDVRDAELSRDPEVLVQFIELAILPVAAGLEGLKMEKNRVKVVFPTVSQLMQYRRTMALAAPEVVALSTLGFDPVEDQDNLVLIVAPSPDDEEGLMQMNELLLSPSLCQPVVVLNHHMCPLTGPVGEFDPIYHLRLLSVQYMTGEGPGDDWDPINEKDEKKSLNEDANFNSLRESTLIENDEDFNETDKRQNDPPVKEDDALEAAMEHAHELGVHQGVTRAMVIRAYPRPWHVFVDTSPDTDADFEVAATFDEFPSQEDVNYAIVECLEGSEMEDELVAQQMQDALEAGQLNAVTEMLGLTSNIEIDMKAGEITRDDQDDSSESSGEKNNEEDDWDHWGTDTV